LGDFGLQSLQAGYVKATTIEACRVAAMQYIRGDGKLYIRIFPHKPVTARPLETRMGKGKGAVDTWVANVCSGDTFVEIEGTNKILIVKKLNALRKKLPLRTKLVYEL